MKVKELIANPENWIKGFFASDENNKPTNPHANKAVKWCLFGAIWKCYKTASEINRIKLIVNQEVFNIASFNDSSTHEEVINLVNILDI